MRQETPDFIALFRAFIGVCAVTICCLFAADLPVQSTPLQPLASSKVIVVHDPQAFAGYNPNPAAIRSMFEGGLTALTEKKDAVSAVRAFVNTNDIVGIKVFSGPGQLTGTRPSVVRALVEQLISAGVPSTNIVIWDRRMLDLRRAGYIELGEKLHVRVAGSMDEGYDTNVFYSAPFVGKLIWSDVEFGRTGEGIGRKSYVSKLLTQQLTKIIQVTPLLNHNVAGVSGNLYGLAIGSIDNYLRFENPTQMASGVPEIYALPQVGDKVALNIVDALLCQYLGEDEVLLQYATLLNELRFSTDPVALDVLSLDELEQQRRKHGAPSPKITRELYENAAVLDLGKSDAKRIEVLTVAPEK